MNDDQDRPSQPETDGPVPADTPDGRPLGVFQSGAPKAGQPAPVFALLDLNGRPVVLSDPRGKVAQFRDEFGATFTILLDSSNQVADAWRLSGIPDTVFIDRNGIVRDVAFGPLSAGSFRCTITQTLNAQ
jgi:AhpC/TSA family